MPARLDHPRTTQVQHLLSQNLPAATVASLVPCHIRSVYRIRANLRKHSTPFPPSTRRRGAPRTVNNTVVQDALRAYLAERPEAMQAELVVFLREELGVRTARSTVSRVLGGVGLRRERDGKGMRKGMRMGMGKSERKGKRKGKEVEAEVDPEMEGGIEGMEEEMEGGTEEMEQEMKLELELELELAVQEQGGGNMGVSESGFGEMGVRDIYAEELPMHQP